MARTTLASRTKVGEPGGWGASRWLAAGAVLLLIPLALKLIGCQGLPGYVSRCSTIPTAPVISPTATPAPEPPMAAVCPFPMAVSSPTDGASVQSPVQVVATAQSATPIYNTRVYVDGQAVFFTFFGNLNTLIWVPNGVHTLEIVSQDQAGFVTTKQLQLNVTGQNPGVSNIQNMPGWINCSSILATGAVCAAGLGTAKSSLTQGETDPTVSGGTSAEFSLLGGTHPYSNALYWNPLGGGSSVSHFTLDMYFYVDVGDAPQALEFDVNQTFGGTRWTWGSECNFDDGAQWDIWDNANAVWVRTSIPCNHFPSKTWIHLIWTLERVGDQVHYISLNVDDKEFTLDKYFNAQHNWFADEIDMAFQMDGNGTQQPYNVWLDRVTLNAF